MPRTLAALPSSRSSRRIALENAQRLAFARRDQDRLLLLAEATDDALYDWNFDTRDFWWGGGILKLLGSDADPDRDHAALEARAHPPRRRRARAAVVRCRAVLQRDALGRRVPVPPRTTAATATSRTARTSCATSTGRAYRVDRLDARRHRDHGAPRAASKRRAPRPRPRTAPRTSSSRCSATSCATRSRRSSPGSSCCGMRGTIDARARPARCIERQAQHLIRLVDDLLDISRITHGKIELERERLELATVIAARGRDRQPADRRAASTRSTSTCRRGPRRRCATARGSRRWSRNIVDERGEVHRARRRHRDQRAQRAAIRSRSRVRDNGIGIAPGDAAAHLQHVRAGAPGARPLRRAASASASRSSRNLVELHGGTVEPRSEGRGRGSELTIRLPPARRRRRAAAERRRGAPRSRCRSAAASWSSTTTRTPPICCRAVLEQLGNTTRVAHDADAARSRSLDEFAPGRSPCSTSACPSSTATSSRAACASRPGTRRCT